MRFFTKKKKGPTDISIPISRKVTFQGRSVPAFINNGGSYFFTDLDIFEDGIVWCWETVDLNQFKERLGRWVVISVPNEQTFSIHHLCSLEISNSEWRFDLAGFYDYVVSLVKEMNPGLNNLYKHFERKVRGITYGLNSSGHVYREVPTSAGQLFPPTIDGESTHLFYKDGDKHFLIRASVFADRSVSISGLPEPYELTFDNLQTLVKNGIVLTELSSGAAVEIFGLGNFTVLNQRWIVSVEDKMLELADLIEKVNGRRTVIETCRDLFSQFLKDPTIERRAQLKRSYENIPTHMRMYVGDMDSKDSSVRIAIKDNGPINMKLIEHLREREY